MNISRIFKKKWHYYSFAFSYSSEGVTTTASVYIGMPDRKITKPRIEAAKEAAGVNSGAVMLSCCYLGKLTNDEMGGA